MIIAAQIIFGLSIGAILFIVFRKIPLLLEYPRHISGQILIFEKIRNQWKTIKSEVGASEFLHETIIPGTEKFLRKIKIILLKLDNFLAKRADNLRARIKKRKKEKKGEGMPG
jgi:hypothetical protein